MIDKRNFGAWIVAMDPSLVTTHGFRELPAAQREGSKQMRVFEYEAHEVLRSSAVSPVEKCRLWDSFSENSALRTNHEF